MVGIITATNKTEQGTMGKTDSHLSSSGGNGGLPICTTTVHQAESKGLTLQARSRVFQIRPQGPELPETVTLA